MLELVGIDPWGEAVYLALIDGPSLTGEEIVGLTGIDADRLPEVLDTLTEQGLIYAERSEPVSYTALPPDSAVEVLLLARERDLSRVRALARRLGERHRRSRAGCGAAALVEVVTGVEGVALCGQQLLRRARREIRGIDAPPYALPVGGGPVDSISNVLGRGVRSRFIHDRSTLWLPGRVRTIERELAAGEEARVLPGVPMKMIIADDGPAVVPLRSSPSSLDACILVQPSPLLDALAALFETLWERAQPFVAGRPPADVPAGHLDRPNASPLTVEERRIVALLSQGMPDEAIARQLGLGLRTVQRRIHALMTALGATSRFQAGVLAAWNGWWSPPGEQRPLSSPSDAP